jgi:hypothetical protein
LWGVIRGIRRVRRRSVGRVDGEDGRRERIVGSVMSGDGGWSIMAGDTIDLDELANPADALVTRWFIDFSRRWQY